MTIAEEIEHLGAPCARLDQLADRLQIFKGSVHAIAKLPEPHLALVCVEIRDGEFVTWKVNLQVCMDFPDCGCAHGWYFTRGEAGTDYRTAAMENFTVRLKEAWAAHFYTATLPSA